MVPFFKKIVLIIFLVLSIVVSSSYTYAATQYLKLHPNSSSYDISQFQKFFKALKIYNGKIDWKYKNLKPDLVAFQVKHKIISNKNDKAAWYVWPKTYNYFTKKYWIKFTKTYNQIFKVKDAKIWDQKYFIVSAYYSPLPGQKKYSTGTYAGDIRLNGNGTHWASWKAVHPWFIAAPSSYNFGTKIQLEWLWVWTVEDRWGAIVRAWRRWHEYDRLDIWMWYWDAGLKRALNWGKKTVKWKILPPTAKNTITYSDSRNGEIQKLAIKIEPKSSTANIKIMQKLFAEAKIYPWTIDGKYSSFKSSIIRFQVENKIIKTKTSIGNWYIWNKTIAKLEEKYPAIFLSNRRKTKIEVQKKQKEIAKKPDTQFEVQASSSVKKKYNISAKQKKQVEKIKNLLDTALKKKYWNNKLRLKTQRWRLNKKLLVIISKVKKESTKEQLRYLYDMITKKIK